MKNINYSVIELKIAADSYNANKEMASRVVKSFKKKVSAIRLADHLNEYHVRTFDPRKEIVSFIVKPV